MFDPVRSSLTWPLKIQALSYSTTTTARDHMGPHGTTWDIPVCSFQARSNRRHVARTDVGALNGGLGGTETQTDLLVPSSATLSRSGGLCSDLRVREDVRLLLESSLRLDGQLGRPEQRLATRLFEYRRSIAMKTDILNYPSRAGTVSRGRVVVSG